MSEVVRETAAQGGGSVVLAPLLTRVEGSPQSQLRRPVAVGLLFGFYAILTLAMTYPFAFHMSDAVVDLGDNLLNTWILAWVTHALTTDPLHLYDANIFYPFRLSLTYSETMLSAAVPAAPILALTSNPVLAHNILWLLSFPISALSMQLLTYRLTRHLPGSIVSGIIFAFCCYRFGQLSHLQLQLIFWLPLCLWSLHIGYESGRIRFFVLAALCFVLQALASFYYGFFAAIVVAVYFGFEAVSAPAAFFKRAALTRIFVFGLIVSIGLLPFGQAYFASQTLYGFQRNVAEIVDLSASISDYFSAPPRNLVYGQLSRPLRSQGLFAGEHFVFPGLITVALAGAGMLGLRWRRHAYRPDPSDTEREAGGALEISVRSTREQRRYALLGVVALVLSFGPAARVFGGSLPLPYAALYAFVPGFTALRAPVRLAALVMLALAVLAAFGLRRVDRMLARRYHQGWGGTVRWIGLALVGLAILGEDASFPVAMTQVSTGSAIPPVYTWLADQPRAPLAEMPSTDDLDFVYEYYSAYHWSPLVNGHSGFMPPDYPQLVSAINAFPEPSAVRTLAAVGIRHVLVHGDAVGETRRAQVRAEAAHTPALTTLLASFGADDIYDLAPRPVAAQDAATARLSLPSTVNAFTPTSAILTVQNPSATPIRRSVDTLSVDTSWDGAPPTHTTVRLQMPMVLEPDAGTSLVVLLPGQSAAGKHQLSVQTGGAFETSVTDTVTVVGAGLPDSRQRDQLNGAIEAIAVPPSVAAGQLLEVQVSVRNTGQAIWLGDPGDNHGRVSFALRGWHTEDGQVVLGGDGNPLGSRALLPGDVYPGQSLTLRLHAPAPVRTGRYTVTFDLVSEFISWFADLYSGVDRVATIDVVEPS